MSMRKHKSFSTGKAAWLSLYSERKWVKRFAVRARVAGPQLLRLHLCVTSSGTIVAGAQGHVLPHVQ